MKAFLFSLLFITSSIITKAQEWVDMMQQPNGNLYQAQQSFRDYWRGKDSTEKGKGYKAFKRWENFAEPRVYPSGDLSLLNQTSKNYEDFLSQYNSQQSSGGGKRGNSNTGNSIASVIWAPVGPMGPINGTGNGQFLKSGRICFVATHPTNTLNLYAGAPAGGFWRSTNAGVSWTTNTDNLPVNGCSDLAIDPINTSIMYLATGDGDAGDTRSTGVLKSLDAGNTWSVTGLTNPVTTNFVIRRLVINPVNTQTLLAATNSGIRRTINSGTSWNTPDGNNCYDIEFKPGNPTIVYSAGAAFRKSIDGGATWTLISAGIPTTGVNRMAIAVTPTNPSVVYVLASLSSNSGFQGFYRSIDSGTTFSLMASTPNLLGWATAGNDTGGQGWYDLCIAASPTNSNEVITGGVNVWRTTNGGTSWSIYGHWTGSGAPFTHADHHDLEYDFMGNLYDSNDGTLYRRTGATWTEVSGTMNISQIYKVGTSALTANLWMSGHQDNGSSFWNGTIYQAQMGGDGMDCFIDRTNNLNKFAEYYSGQFMKSIGGGAYTGCTTGMTGSAPWVTIWKQDPQTAARLYAGRQEMFVSNNLATSWTQLTAMPAAGAIREFAIAPSNNQVIYVLKSAGIYKTINGGTSWTTVTGTVPVGSAAPDFVVIDPLDPNNVWVVLSGYSAGNKIFVTTNGGTTWTNFTGNLPNLPGNCAVYQAGTNDRIYIGMDAGVYYRDNIAASWTLYNSGLPNTPVVDMEISPANPTKIIAATYGRGMWNVDVIPNAPPVSAFNYSGTICTGVATTFNDASVNSPSTWSWSVNPAGGVTINTPTLQNPGITFANAGTYTVSLFTTNLAGAGTTTSQIISVTATPTVIVTNSMQTICIGNTSNITASGAASYSWSNGGITNSISVSPIVTTIYTVTGNNGVCNSNAFSTVVVVPLPNITATSNESLICVGHPVTLNGSGGLTYTWQPGNIIGSPVSFTPVANQIYTVTGTDANNCSFSQTVEVLVSPCTGVLRSGNELIVYNVFPNPASEQVNISYPSNNPAEIKIELSDAIGKLILTKTFVFSKSNPTYSININGVAKGAYFIKLIPKSGEAKYVKLVKE